MWHLSFSREEQQRLRGVPLWQDYRFQAAALLALDGERRDHFSLT